MKRIGVAVVAMVIVAEGAAWLLRPKDEVIEPARVAESDYFEPAQIERAREYRGGQRLLLVAGIGAQGALLVTLVLGRPQAARRLLERLEERPLAGAAAAGAGLSVALTAAALPADLWAHERAVDYGLSVQSLDSWLSDVGKSAAIGAALAGAGAALLYGLLRRVPRWWPVPAAIGVVGIAALFSWLAPVLLAPIFNRFEQLPEGSAARAEVIGLAERAGVDVGEVYKVDASRRSTALNAYVGGLGPTKRVVLYDNLIEETDRAELRSVVAHELAHQANHDVRRGIAFVAIVAPLGLFFVREAGQAMARRGGAGERSIAALPGYVLALGVATAVIGVAGNQLSRAIEAEADEFALELTDDPAALIDLQQRLVRSNLGDPDPPELVTFLLGTHPPAIERIGAAVAYEEMVPKSDQAAGR